MKCPKCGNEDVKMVEIKGNRVSFRTKMLILFGIVAVCVISFGLLYVNTAAALIFFFAGLGILVFITYIIDVYKSSKPTMTKVICKNCGHIWYLD